MDYPLERESLIISASTVGAKAARKGKVEPNPEYEGD